MTIPEAMGDQIKSPRQVWDILGVGQEASATPKQHSQWSWLLSGPTYSI